MEKIVAFNWESLGSHLKYFFFLSLGSEAERHLAQPLTFSEETLNSREKLLIFHAEMGSLKSHLGDWVSSYQSVPLAGCIATRKAIGFMNSTTWQTVKSSSQREDLSRAPTFIFLCSKSSAQLSYAHFTQHLHRVMNKAKEMRAKWNTRERQRETDWNSVPLLLPRKVDDMVPETEAEPGERKSRRKGREEDT